MQRLILIRRLLVLVVNNKAKFMSHLTYIINATVCEYVFLGLCYSFCLYIRIIYRLLITKMLRKLSKIWPVAGKYEKIQTFWRILQKTKFKICKILLERIRGASIVISHKLRIVVLQTVRNTSCLLKVIKLETVSLQTCVFILMTPKW